MIFEVLEFILKGKKVKWVKKVEQIKKAKYLKELVGKKLNK